MFEINLHKIEKSGKKIILKLLLIFMGSSVKRNVIADEPFQKILIFRLDQRIGNGLLLLPLANGIRSTSPESQVHILIHHPVANLFATFQNGQFSKIWPYKQKELLNHPWKMIGLIRKLRREQFDIILNCTNPDDFSTSQALFGKMLKGRILAGFSSKKDGSFLNDIQIHSTTQKHYSDAMLDLWRHFDPNVKFISGGLIIKHTSDIKVKKKILFWLGATEGKELSIEIVNIIREIVNVVLNLDMEFAIGPDDHRLLTFYPKDITEHVILWNASLPNTAIFFLSYSIFLSTDTGPMHLAAAFGMNMINIFTHRNFKQYGYHNDQNQFSIRMMKDRDDPIDFKRKLQQTFELLLKNINF